MKKINKPIYEHWVKMLDEYRNKFTTPLTREQACEVILDDSKFENNEFVEPKYRDLFIADFQVYGYTLLKELNE